MKSLKDYKGVAIIYLVIIIVSIFSISLIGDNTNDKQVKDINTNKVVINYDK